MGRETRRRGLGLTTRKCVVCGWAMAILAVAAMPCAGRRRGVSPSRGADEPTARLKRYRTHYYIIYTDLPVETVREAVVRLKAMAEEYHQRTRGFAGVIKRRLPFYLFSRGEDYYAAGGLPGSTGTYDGSKLMAMASRRFGDGFWHTVQHEGFHQFADTVIRGRLPVWVDEGLADYFGHGIWTGDGLVTGLIPRGRMRRVQRMIKTKRMLGFLEMMTMTQKRWNGQMNGRNYDQAWSMTYFLVHAYGGRYREAFGQFIKDIASGKPWEAAFVKRFGRDTTAFQRRYADWWLALPPNPTPEIHTIAVVQTLTSFLARATARKQEFKDFDEFFARAAAGKLDIASDSDQWLPGRLLARAVARAGKMTGWALRQKSAKGTMKEKTRKESRWPQIVLTDRKGKVFTGSFELRRGKVVRVGVVISPPKDRKSFKKISVPF